MKYVLTLLAVLLLGACEKKEGAAGSKSAEGAETAKSDVKELTVYSGRKEVYATPLSRNLKRRQESKLSLSPVKLVL